MNNPSNQSRALPVAAQEAGSKCVTLSLTQYDRFRRMEKQRAALVGALRDCMDRLNHHDAQSVPEVANAQAALDGKPESEWAYITPGMELRRTALQLAKK